MRSEIVIEIGIDLGTTNSLVAYWSEDGAKIIPNALGSNLTPSVVSVDESGTVYVGQIGKERLITHPLQTAYCFKRFMGSEKKYNLSGHLFSPEELSSLVLKSLKNDAEAYLNADVTRAVISVPAYFNDAQRKATQRAAELAGLEVARIISEPTAAAIAYGLHQAHEEIKFLVFDLGGGTFDVSILELFEGVMEVKSIAGDNYLGGEDFTRLLEEYFLNKLQIPAESLDSRQKSILYKQAEQSKFELTSGDQGRISLNLQNEIKECIITRGDFEKISGELLLRLRNPIERALRDAGMSPGEMDAVVLIGGATRMPVIRSSISKMFGKIPYLNINPDEAVALGAAVQLALMDQNAVIDEVILTDVCPYTLGTNIVKDFGNGKYESGYFLPIIERNTPIPVSRVERLSTVTEDQSHIHVEIYQGESRKVENNLKLGELNIKIPKGKAGEQMIDLRYTYDVNGLLEVEAVTVKTGAKASILIEKSPGSMSREEIEMSLKRLENLKIHPRDKQENKLLLARGERLYEETLSDMREYIANLLARFEKILATQDERLIKKGSEELKAILDEIEGRS